MPTNHDETLQDRYARELAAMDPKTPMVKVMAGNWQEDSLAPTWQQLQQAVAEHDTLEQRNQELMQRIAELEAVRLNAQAVPDGWKLVPVDATDEMVKVGDQKTWVFPSRECWAAMLSAAPAAPQPTQQPLTDEKDALLRQALEALEGFANITNDSQGVKGYHLNGDIAEWDEFDEVDAASNTIEAIRNHLGVKND